MGAKRKTQGATLSRRAWIGVVAGGAVTALAGARWMRGSHAPLGLGGKAITVHASPTCGCCHMWVAHLEENGFAPVVNKVADVTPLKTKLGVPESLWSCHTAVADGYVVEGHVPADLIQRMLTE
jgi:hypothetical protein